MTDQAHIRNTRRERGHVAPRIDFAISCENTLVFFVPLTEAAEVHCDQFFAGAMAWGGARICEHRFAADIIDELFAEGFRLSLDGREIVPARRARPC